MGDEVHCGAGGGGHGHEREETPRSESLRHRRAERQQPYGIEDQMAEVGMDERVSDECPDVGGPTSGPRDVRQDAGVDRKSTRLNSSHSQISYAVFCLK